MNRLYRFINAREKLMKGTFFLCALFSILALLTITIFLFVSGTPFIFKVGIFKFLFGKDWAPISEPPSYQIFPMIVASIYVTALSVAMGIGIGLFSAICLYKFCPKCLVKPISWLVNLLAGIPSVIYGLWGLRKIVPYVRDYLSLNGVGHGIFSASIVLAIMILPTIISISLDALKAVDERYFAGALALGATKEQATFRIMFPAAKSGILAAIVLAIGRAIGETMAVIMVIGGSASMPKSLFQSVRTMTANIALGATELTGDPFTALISTGVVLFVFTLILNISFSMIKSHAINKSEGNNKGFKNGKIYYIFTKIRSLKQNKMNKKRKVLDNSAQINADTGKELTSNIEVKS